MARPKGSPKLGGRQKGTPNKATAEIKAIAREYGREAILKLVDLMRNSSDDKVQKAACDSLLDRGYGRPTQSVEAVGDGAQSFVLVVPSNGRGPED